MQKHILSVLTENKSGVLSRISGLLRRKLFNIHSLTVGVTQDPNISKFTIVISGDLTRANQAASLIEKLVEILSVKILDIKNTIFREIVLAKLKVKTKKEKDFLHTIEKEVLTKEIYHSKDILYLELIDTSKKLESFLKKLKTTNIEIKDWVRSGVIAIEKPR